MSEQITFRVSFDPDEDGFIVHQSSNAYSFAMVPKSHTYYFGRDKARAFEQVRRLHAWQAKGNKVDLTMIETPSRFEAIADVKYGCAW